MNDSISRPKEENDIAGVPPVLPTPPAGFIPLEALECEEVEFIDAIEDSPREAGDGTPILEASVITTSPEKQQEAEGGVTKKGDEAPIPDTEAAGIGGKIDDGEDDQQGKPVEEDELDALERRQAEGWQSPWKMPRGVNSDFLEELIQRNLERFDLPPGVYAKATSSESIGGASPSMPIIAEERWWQPAEGGASPPVERKDPSQPSGQSLFDKEPLIVDDGSPRRDKKRKKKKQKPERKEHRRGGKLRKVGEHHHEGDGSGRHKNRLSAKRRRISLEEGIDSPLHAYREPSRTMELDLDEDVPEFHVPKWTGSAFETTTSAAEASKDNRKDKPEEEVVNLVAGDADTSGVSGGSGDQPGTPKVQFDKTKPLKPELVLAASVLPPTVPSSGNRARVRTCVVTAVKAPLVSIVGNCTDMRKVEVALKRHVDKKGLWWDWSYGKKSKLETGGGYVRVDLDPLLRQVCMCTVASFKEVLYHAKRYIQVDENKTIEVDCEDEHLVDMGSNEVEAEVPEEPTPLKIPARASPFTERMGTSKATGRRKWSGKDWNKTTSAGKEPAWKSSAGSGRAGWKNNKNGKWDGWNDWKDNDRKKDDWKNDKGNWKDSETSKKWTSGGGGGGGGKKNKNWGSWDDGGKWEKDWSESWGDDKWKSDWNGKWDDWKNARSSASKSPEWKPRTDWSDSDTKCQWDWNGSKWESKEEEGPTVTPKPLEVTEPAEVASPGSRTRRYGSEDEEDLRSPTSALVTEEIPNDTVSEGEAMSIVDDEEKPPGTDDVVSAIPPEELAQVTQLCHRLFWPLEDIQWLFDVTSPSDSQPSEAQSLLRELALNTIVVCPTGGLAKYADGEGDIPGTVVLRDIPEPVPVGGLVPSKKVEQNISSLTVELVKYAAADLPELRHRVSALQYIRAACDIIEFLDGAEWDEGQIMQLLGDADEARRIPPDEV